ncbi:MAG: TonB-dependent receptor [Saprospiraceae bacterium]|nr:TonB-dependent receptor [Saprospiraceae bacterium]
MIKRTRISFILLLLFFTVFQTYSQSIRGKIIDKNSQQEQPGIQLTLKNTDHTVFTNGLGNFSFNEVKAGSYTLVATLNEAEIIISNITTDGTDKDLGNIELIMAVPNTLISDISVIDVTDLAGIENENDNYSSVLAAGRDPFVNASAFNLGAGRFRPRGYQNEDSEMMMNGMLMNDQDDGRVLWTAWSGLNDVLRNQTQIINMASNDYTFGGIGGGTVVDLRASDQREGTKAVYSFSNRSYQHRAMITHSSGMQKNGWAYSLAASHRYGKQGYIEGTYFQGTSYFVSIDRKINDKHLLNAVIFGAPQRRGRSTGSFQEMYDIADNNYYNPNWGYQNGEVRNSREYRINQPVAMLRHDWKISNKTNLTTTAGVQWGTFASSRLDWYEAPDPRPDYYRRLPSYATDEVTKDLITTYLKSDINHRQLDWGKLYEANSTRNYVIENVDGIPGNNVSGKLAAYVVEEEHYDNQKLSFNTIINSQIANNFSLIGGIQVMNEKVHYFRKLDDLLGADFYVDFNRFAIRDFPDNPDAGQNNLNTPNRIVKEGDIYGHNYDVNTTKAMAWSQGIYKTRKLDFMGALSLTSQSFYREGYYKVGLFPDNSYGKSETQRFLNYGLKAGVTYKLDGRNYFVANGSYRTRAPYANESYISPRVRDQIVRDLTSEKITAGEISYLARYTKLKARVSAFYTNFEDRISNDVFYHEEYNTFVNYLATGIDRRHTGIEMGMEYTLNGSFSVLLAGSVGEYIHTSRPTATISRDNSAEDFVEDRTIYINNYYVAGMPQHAGTIGLNYTNRNYWFLNLNVNYFGKNYLSFNPDRRTAEAVEGVILPEQAELFHKIIDQEKLPDAITVDIFCGKSFRFKDGSTLRLNLNVGNILNNKNFITGGFEQFRFDFEGKDVNRFAPRYFYAFGTNYNLNVAYIFSR